MISWAKEIYRAILGVFLIEKRVSKRFCDFFEFSNLVNFSRILCHHLKRIPHNPGNCMELIYGVVILIHGQSEAAKIFPTAVNSPKKHGFVRKNNFSHKICVLTIITPSASLFAELKKTKCYFMFKILLPVTIRSVGVAVKRFFCPKSLGIELFCEKRLFLLPSVVSRTNMKSEEK